MFLSEYDGQVQVIATTRPQGYSDEFEKIGIDLTTSYLLPLEKKEALSYAQKLVAQKIQGLDEQRQTLDRLREAANEPATERLLTTPLQITILTALVQHRGRAPRERWNLFHNYFNFTYAREIERNTYASELLRNYKHHIEQIHARVGLLLQVEAERDGGASARISRARLEEIICAVLADAGFDDNEDRQMLVNDIVSAAKLRLVFLVEPEPGSFGFEIRSFQEFMCAWALTTGREHHVESRLSIIARAPMFRNVTLFCASRLFSEGQHICDVFARNICINLDSNLNDPAANITKAGASLALETLEEGAVLSYPKYARQLLQRACEILTLPPSHDDLRLAKVATTEIKNTLLGAIEEEHNSSLKQFNVRSVWLVLMEMVNLGNDGAVAIANKIWGNDTDLRLIISDCRRFGVPLNAWLKNKILENRGLIPPDLLFGLRSSRLHVQNEFDWIDAFGEIFDISARWEDRISGMDAIKIGRFSLVDKFSHLNANSIFPEWHAWSSVALYELAPDSETLANALESIAASKTNPALYTWRSSWPLAASLEAVMEEDGILDIAKRVRELEFGSIKEWMALEVKWSRNITSLVNADISSRLPWELDSPLPPYTLLNWWTFNIQTFGPNSEVLQRIINKFNSSNDSRLRQWLAQVGMAFLIRNPGVIHDKNLMSEELMLDWLIEDPSFVGLMIPKPKFISETVWLRILGTITVPADLSYLGNFSQFFRNAPAIVPENVLNIFLHSYVVHFSQDLDVIDSLKIVWGNQSEEYKSSLPGLILKMVFDDLSYEQEKFLLERIQDPMCSELHFEAFLSALRESKFSSQRKIRILSPISSDLKNTSKFEQVLVEMKKIFQLHSSGLDNATVWDQLALTLPRPVQRHITSSFQNISTSPVRLKNLDLKDVAGFRNINFEFNIPDGDQGQWIVILGENGAGKTSILRAITLALRNTDDVTIWPANSLSLPWLRIPQSETEKISEASISITLENDAIYTTKVRSEGVPVFIKDVSGDGYHFPIFSYGCRRGNALGGSTGKVNLSTKDGLEIASLFDSESDLIHAESWLIQLDGDSQKNSKSAMYFRYAVQSLCQLLDAEDIYVTDMMVFVKLPKKPAIRISYLSDGYLTSAGWLIDLLARWITFAEQSGRDISSDFMSKMTGMVLIDELDLHLHPQWQIEIISKTRKLMPKMSFVITTHNPLTLVGAAASEIWTLSQLDGEVSANVGVDNPMLLTGAEIYNEYFGIRSMYPKEIGEKLQRYGFLSRFALRDDAQEKEMLLVKDELSQLSLLPTWEIVERRMRSYD